MHLASEHEVVLHAEARLLAAKAEHEAAQAAYEDMVLQVAASAWEASRAAGIGAQPLVWVSQYIGTDPHRVGLRTWDPGPSTD